MQIDWDDLIARANNVSDTRGGKITNFEVRPLPGGGEALLLKCDDWIADQFDILGGPECSRAELSKDTKRTFNHGFRFTGPVPESVLAAVEVLSNALSMPAPKHVDVAMSLDWYNQPDDEGEIARTQAGYWIWTTKHALYPSASNSRKSRREMVAALVEFIRTHPLYAYTTAIVTAPGHKADGRGFGEILAREVASKVGIPYVETIAPGGERPQQKETPQDLSDAFVVQGTLTGAVLVLDDVYHTGQSASAVALAARRAGAANVISLTVARTIRR
jgi:adenine/guanine phosphoribosyltransferase-like PRPP-binding protein